MDFNSKDNLFGREGNQFFNLKLTKMKLYLYKVTAYSSIMKEFSMFVVSEHTDYCLTNEEVIAKRKVTDKLRLDFKEYMDSIDEKISATSISVKEFKINEPFI